MSAKEIEGYSSTRPTPWAAMPYLRAWNFLRNGPRLPGGLDETHARLQDVDVELDLLVGKRIEPALLIRRPSGTAEPGAADVRAIAERADKVGVETNELASPDHPTRGLAEPGIGPAPGCEKPGLDPLAAEFDVHLMENRPQRRLADAGSQFLAHPCHARLADGDGNQHGLDLVIGLDHPGAFRHAGTTGDLVTHLLERIGALEVEPVGGDAPAGPRGRASRNRYPGPRP